MSNRELVRGAMKSYARKHGYKEGQYVKVMFDRMQIKQHGETLRKIRQVIGTKPKHLWKSRIESALGQ